MTRQEELQLSDAQGATHAILEVVAGHDPIYAIAATTRALVFQLRRRHPHAEPDDIASFIVRTVLSGLDRMAPPTH